MLIIFDLDDTLIDTSGAVTPFKMRECLRDLVAQGVCVPDFDRAYRELLSINLRSPRSKDAWEEFLSSRGVERFLDRTMALMNQPLPTDFRIPTTPNAKEILEYFQKTDILALVTGGQPSFQLEKLEKAGIDRSIFCKIAIPEDSVKKPFYEGLIREFSIPPGEIPSQVFVCGDRIAMDLVPAFELGCTTIHMRWGRGCLKETEHWVHHAISDLNELKRIVKR